MPLAEGGGGVAGVGEQLAQGVLPGREPVIALARQGHAAVAGPDGQPAAQDGRAGRGALGLDVVVLEPHPLAGQGIDAWGGRYAAVAADVPPADVITEMKTTLGRFEPAWSSELAIAVPLSPGGCVGPPTAANLRVLYSPLSSFTGERASHKKGEPGNQASSLTGLHPYPNPRCHLGPQPRHLAVHHPDRALNAPGWRLTSAGARAPH